MMKLPYIYFGQIYIDFALFEEVFKTYTFDFITNLQFKFFFKIVKCLNK